MSVHKKLMEARIKLQSADLKKTGHNKFAGYTYFELGDFLPTVQDIFAGLGLCGTISFRQDYACLTIIDADGGINATSLEFVCPMASAQLKGCHDVQNLGASMTYIRRYLWVNALEIVEHDALDATTGSDKKGALISKEIITPTSGAWESMDEESQKFLQGIADDVIETFRISTIKDTVEVLERNVLDNEEKIALWTRFDSKLRAAIKKYNSEKKEG